MSTRPRTPASRTKKSSSPPIFSGEAVNGEPPVLTDAVGDDDERTSARAEPTSEITDRSLQRREIPSFSTSREARIAEAAYWRAERRGFAPGHELDDWLDAERQIDDGN